MAYKRWGAVPIGGVIAWLKSLTGCPALPTEYAECNGQIETDVASPFYGVTYPDANGALDSIPKFLRGNTTSGGTGGSVDHTHYISGLSGYMSGQTDTGYANISDYGHSHGFTTGGPSGTIGAATGSDVYPGDGSHTHSGSTDSAYASVSDSGHYHNLSGASWYQCGCISICASNLPPYLDVVWVLRRK